MVEWDAAKGSAPWCTAGDRFTARRIRFEARAPADGIAWRGLLVRHLVLPGGLAGAGEILAFLAREVSRRTCRPCYRAAEYPPLDRPMTTGEYEAALAMAAGEGQSAS